MHGIAIALVTEEKEMLAFLQHRLEATQMTRTVFTHVGFPTAATGFAVPGASFVALCR